MRQMEAQVTGIQRLQGFNDVYEVSLSVPEIYNDYQTNLVPVKLFIGTKQIEIYKRLYLTEEKFTIMLP
jgi:hypothetical protein